MRKGLVGFALVATTLALTPAAASAATITPDILTDEAPNLDADCSLREAVSSAVVNAADTTGCTNGDAGMTDEIVLNLAGPYTVTTSFAGLGEIDVGAGGPIVIRSDNPALRRTISMAAAAGEDRVFALSSAASDLTLRTLTINNDQDVVSSGGGVVYASVDGNTLTLDNSRLDATAAGVNAVNGGVVRVDGADSTLIVKDSVITGGDVSSQGGGIYSEDALTDITRSRIEMNDASTGTQGGGISQSGGSLMITDSELVDNDVDTSSTAARGGAVSVVGSSSLTVKRSLISGGSVTSSSVEEGGGIFVGHMGSTLIANSAIHGNTAGSGASAGTGSGGGGIYVNNTGAADLNHVTFLGNSAFDAAGGDHIHSEGTGGRTYTASIISASGLNNPCAGGTAMTSGGFNALGYDPQCPPNGTTDVGVAGPLGPPLNNGGTIVGGTGGSSIRSLAITDASSAFDLVPTATCGALLDAPVVDQRGVARPISAACDAGSFEAPCTEPSALPGCPALPAPSPSPSPSPAAGATGLRAAALKKCLNKKTRKARKKCAKRADKLPL